MTSPDPLARVYVAAPIGEAHVADLLRALLDRAGFHVVSQWTDRLRKQSACPSREEMAAIHRANSAELDGADLVVAWTAAGTPRATYGEIAHALAKGKPVLWLQGPRGEGSNSYDTEPLVRVLVVDLGETRMERDVAIVAAVREMAAGLARPSADCPRATPCAVVGFHAADECRLSNSCGCDAEDDRDCGGPPERPAGMWCRCSCHTTSALGAA